MLNLSMQHVSMAQVLSVDVRILGTLQGAACWCRLLVESRLVAALPYLRPLPIRVHRVWRVRSCELMAVVAHGILRRAPFCHDARLPSRLGYRSSRCVMLGTPQPCIYRRDDHRDHRYRHRNCTRSSTTIAVQACRCAASFSAT